MQVVILAGGLGTRLKRITKRIPKPMIPINGKPFLEYQISLLKNQGFHNFLILTGYLGKMIQDYFTTGKKWKVRIHYSYETTPLGTGGALKKAESLLEDNFLLVYGDSYLDIDYQNMILDFQQTKCYLDLAVFLDKKKETGVIPNILMDQKTHLVISYQKDASCDYTHIDAGTLVASKKICQFLSSGISALENDLFLKMIQIKKIKAYEVSKRFYDIGTFKRLKIFKETIL